MLYNKTLWLLVTNVEHDLHKKRTEETVFDLAPFDRMADGRAFTDYRSRCQKLTNLTSYDERMFLMNNAEAIIGTTTQICKL